jgi:hypothetical protein
MMDPVVMPPVVMMPVVMMPVMPVMMERGFRRIGFGDRDARESEEADEHGCSEQVLDHDEGSPFQPLRQALP